MPTQTDLLHAIYKATTDVALSDVECRLQVELLSRPTTNYEEPEPMPNEVDAEEKVVYGQTCDECDTLWYSISPGPSYCVNCGAKRKLRIISPHEEPEPPRDYGPCPVCGYKPSPGELKASDPVNHPSHYTQGSMECIEAIEGLGLGFHEAQVLKYLCRWRHKNGLEDLRKARWYLQRLIQWNEAGLPQFFEGPPLDITGGVDAADYVAGLYDDNLHEGGDT